jgi:hypothetical protein
MPREEPTASSLFEVWRETTARALEVAGNVAEQFVASEGFSSVVARAAKLALDIVTPLRQEVNQLAETASEWTNIPTRGQMVELASRVNRLELILDDLDVRTDELLRLLDGEVGDGRQD